MNEFLALNYESNYCIYTFSVAYCKKTGFGRFLNIKNLSSFGNKWTQPLNIESKIFNKAHNSQQNIKINVKIVEFLGNFSFVIECLEYLWCKNSL